MEKDVRRRGKENGVRDYFQRQGLLRKCNFVEWKFKSYI